MSAAATPPVELDHLLRHGAWARRLARALVGDPAEADDVLQEGWLAALRHPPPSGTAVRPWLRTVLTNVVRDRIRKDNRRARRERVVVPHLPTSPADLVAQVQQQNELATLVLALREPYRQTLLLIFYQELSSAEAARRLAVPGGTVRRRLQIGLAELRAELDRRNGGQRQRWTRALVPLFGARAEAGVGLFRRARERGSALLVLGGMLLLVGAFWPPPPHFQLQRTELPAIPGPPPRPPRLRATAFAPSTAPREMVTGPASLARPGMEKDTTLTGRVLAPDGRGMAGARVTATEDTCRPWVPARSFQATTDDNGEFRMILSAGQYDLLAEALPSLRRLTTTGRADEFRCPQGGRTPCDRKMYESGGR